MSGGWQGVCGCQGSEGVCPRALCSVCSFSPQLGVCPQVSSCLSACHDVLAALVRCLSQRHLSPRLSPLVSTCISGCVKGALGDLVPSRSQPCPSLGPLPFSVGPVAGLCVAIVTVAKSLRLIASHGAVGSIHAGG